AKAYCKEKGITKSYELQKGPNKDNCLSSILYKRKLMDKVFSSIKAEQEAQQLETLASALETFGGSGK
ncbi:MAG: hypothetical protein Q7S22_06240, partial [Candidatus Micrarchaeota archaeon]|nr:hypothetical protein [Candidatus Micrarchaeota archaeon]